MGLLALVRLNDRNGGRVYKKGRPVIIEVDGSG
jgi:hypothetical protein